MCIIAVYPKGLPFNNGELEKCFENNPDGAGVMWQEKGKVHIKKGFMKQKSLLKFLKTLPTNVDRVIHFRIATSGKVSGACCHPFPVAGDFKQMMKTESVAPVAYAHNGVLTDYTPKEGMKSPFSDTMIFGKEVLNHLLDTGIDLFDPIIDVMLEATIDGDRMVIMNDHELITLGKFVTSKTSGAQYSNTSYSYSRNIFKSYGYYDYYSDPCASYYSGGCSSSKTTGKKGTTDTKSVTLSKGYNDSDICVSFTAEITFDPSSKAVLGYTRMDYENFVYENLEERNIYGIDVAITGVGDYAITFEVKCMAYMSEICAPFHNIHNGSTIHDTWVSNNKEYANISVDIAISDLCFDKE